MSLKLNLEQGHLRPDYHGELFFCDKLGQQEIALGTFSEGGSFEASSWFCGEDLNSSLKEIMREAYWGEREAADHVEQEDWGDGMVAFMDLPMGDDLPSCGLETLLDMGEAELRSKRRFCREGGVVLHGVYAKQTTVSQELLLIGAGRQLASWSLQKDLVLSDIDWSNLPLFWAPKWPNIDGEAEDLNGELIEAVFGERLPSAQVFVGRKKRMLSLAEDAESRGFGVEVFAHLNDEQKFRLVIRSQKSAAQWWPLGEMGTLLKALADEERAWVDAHWNTVNSIPDDVPTEQLRKVMLDLWAGLPLPLLTAQP